LFSSFCGRSARSPPQVSFYFLIEQFIYLFILRSDTENYLTTSSPIGIRDCISQTTAFRISERPTIINGVEVGCLDDTRHKPQIQNRTSIRREEKRLDINFINCEIS
jgi:hypothetical protein